MMLLIKFKKPNDDTIYALETAELLSVTEEPHIKDDDREADPDRVP